MANEVMIDLDLLRQVGEKLGSDVAICLYDDGSGFVCDEGEIVTADEEISIYHPNSHNAMMRDYLDPGNAILKDLDLVWQDEVGDSAAEEAYIRLKQHLTEGD